MKYQPLTYRSEEKLLLSLITINRRTHLREARLQSDSLINDYPPKCKLFKLKPKEIFKPFLTHVDSGLDLKYFFIDLNFTVQQGLMKRSKTINGINNIGLNRPTFLHSLILPN